MILGTVDDEVGSVLAPVLESELPVAGALDALQVAGGNDLVGIDIGLSEGNSAAGNGGDGIH